MVTPALQLRIDGDVYADCLLRAETARLAETDAESEAAKVSMCDHSLTGDGTALVGRWV